MFAKRNTQTNLRHKSTGSIDAVKTCEVSEYNAVEKSSLEADADNVNENDACSSCSIRHNSAAISKPDYVLEATSSKLLKEPIKFSKQNHRKRTLHSTKSHIKSQECVSNAYERFGIYQGNRSLNLDDDQRATASFSVNADVSCDHRSILERNAAIGDAILTGELQEGIYRGKGAYKPILRRREGAIAAGKYTGLYGPVRGSDSIRMTMRIDLNPEICKDYKETGYCGFGDTCKFLHDRSDYKAGWQLEKEWEDKQKQKQVKLQRLADRLYRQTHQHVDEGSEDLSDSDASDNDDEEIPFACLICKKRWQRCTNPVVTTCGHYFCERCAFKHYSKSPKCAICGQQTCGIFNSAEQVIQKFIEKRITCEHKSSVKAGLDDTLREVTDSE